jgi:dTDP-4-amino-4,6-dideoxygalactose transaminase
MSYDIGARAVNLPSGFNMTEELVARVIDSLRDILRTRSFSSAMEALP